MVRQSVSANLKADIKKGKWAVKAGTNRGTRAGDLDVVVEYDVYSPKKTFDVKYTLNTPFDSMKSVEGSHKIGALYNSWRNFEVSLSLLKFFKVTCTNFNNCFKIFISILKKALFLSTMQVLYNGNIFPVL